MQRRVSYRDHPVRYALFVPLLVHNSVIYRARRGRRLTKETTKNMTNIYSFLSPSSVGRKIVLAFGILRALLLSLPSHAQDGRSKVPINRTISGFTLGVTTPAEARAIIQRQGGKIILEVGVQAGSKDASYIVSGLNYARRPTQTVAMFFYKGHLHSIDFIFDGWDVLEQIESELEDKYGMMIESEGMFKKKSIADAFTSLEVVRTFDYEGHSMSKNAYIAYIDLELERARSAEKESEI